MGNADIIGYMNCMLKLFKTSVNKILGQAIPEMKVELQEDSVLNLRQLMVEETAI